LRAGGSFPPAVRISIAPRDTLDWGHAMLAELHHVQGNLGRSALVSR